MLPLDPEQLDALDMLGVIYARSGQGPRDRAMALVAPQRGGLRPSAHQPGDPRRQASCCRGRFLTDALFAKNFPWFSE